jgi:hypothetical protein
MHPLKVIGVNMEQWIWCELAVWFRPIQKEKGSQKHFEIEFSTVAKSYDQKILSWNLKIAEWNRTLFSFVIDPNQNSCTNNNT